MSQITNEDVATALVKLSMFGVPADVQELLIHGDPSRRIPPGALKAALGAVADGLPPTTNRLVPPITIAHMTFHGLDQLLGFARSWQEIAAMSPMPHHEKAMIYREHRGGGA